MPAGPDLRRHAGRTGDDPARRRSGRCLRADGLRSGALKVTPLVPFLACLTLASACARQPPAAPAPSDEAPRWPSQTARPPLPEDPAAGKRAQEQWKGHLAQEDRERQLARDRHALADHQAIVGLLVGARREVERARGGAVAARVADVERQVDQHLAKINLWGNVSPLTATYRSMIASLRSAPRHADASAEPSAAWNRQLAGIRSYLREAAESEGEGE